MENEEHQIRKILICCRGRLTRIELIRILDEVNRQLRDIALR
jgi:hypothetical protein